jgi:RHS repeat-associated protein
VAFVFDWDGNRLEKYTYDAFGWPTVVSWTGTAWDDAHPRTWSNYGNRFMFNGREFFAEMGVMDYRHRFYHPALGRFLQPDPTGFDAGDMNLFRYCGDDPVDGSDPTGLYSSLTSFGGGDWVKGSDGLTASDWNHKHDQPAGNISFGLVDVNGGSKNDNGMFYGAISRFTHTLRKDGAGVSSQEIGSALFADGRENGRDTAKDFRSDDKGRYNVEHASSEYVNGGHLFKVGPVPGAASRYSPHAHLPSWTPGTHRLIGSHGHGIQSRAGFEGADVPGANGAYGSRFMASLGLAADRGTRVIIYIPSGGNRGLYFHSSDGRSFFTGE